MYERSLIVKEGKVKSDTLQSCITPDELVKVTGSRKENVYKLDDISLKTNESFNDTKDIRVEQVKSKLDKVQDKTEKVTLIREKLPERQQIEKMASGASKPEVTGQQSLVDTPEKLTVMDKTTTVFPNEEIKTRQKQMETKTVEEVQSKTAAVKNEFGRVTPFHITGTKQEQVEQTVSVAPVMEVTSGKHFIVKDGDVKSDTLQRFVIPDKLKKDIISRKEDIYVSGEVSLISAESAKESVETLTEKQEIADKGTQVKEVKNEFKPTKQKQTQLKAERTAVTPQKTPKTLVGQDAKTEIVVRDHFPVHEEVRYDNTSPNQPDCLTDQRQVTFEGIQSKTDTVKDIFLGVAPNVETKEEQMERKASRTPVMDVVSEKPLIVKEQNILLEVPQKYISPDNLVKDTTS